MIRVFLDANILFSAAYTPGKGSSLIFSAGKARQDITLLTSKFAVGEAFKNLAENPKSPPGWPFNLQAIVADTSLSSHPPAWLMLQLAKKVQSQGDLSILAGAVHVGADWLATGNSKCFGHLYNTKVRGVLVLRTRAVLDRIRPQLERVL